jgi:hypothetical protein
LPDLLIELRLQRFFIFGVPLAFGREDFRQAFYRLPLPLRDLIGVNAVLTGNLADRSLPLDRFQGDPDLEFRGKGFSLHFLCVHRSSWVSSDFTTLIGGLVFGEYYSCWSRIVLIWSRFIMANSSGRSSSRIALVSGVNLFAIPLPYRVAANFKNQLPK